MLLESISYNFDKLEQIIVNLYMDIIAVIQ